MLLIRLLAVSILLTGCATRGVVDFVSIPPGATISAEDRTFGVAPQRRFNDPERLVFGPNGCTGSLGDLTARWLSGATTVLRGAHLCRNSTNHWVFTFVRPPAAPGAEVDANYALQLQRNAIMAQQAAAAQSAADAANLSAMQQTLRSMQPPPPPAPVICNSQRTMPGVVQTVCR